MLILGTNEDEIINASELIKSGKLIAFPTETIYGLGADATNQEAVQNIFKSKGRPNFNPLIAHVCNIKMAQELGEFTPLATKLATDFWPGPLTFILNKKKSNLCDAITAGLDTIAIRMPDNELALKLIEYSGVPLAAPSANKSGTPSPTQASHVINNFSGEEIDAIIDGGPTDVGLESTIIDLTGKSPTILRHGGITKEIIEKYLSIDIDESTEKNKAGEVKSPGQLLKHYAPSLPVRLNVSDVKDGEALLTFGPIELKGEKTLNLSIDGSLKEAAHNLFAMLIELDSKEFTGIAVTPIPNEDIGVAINDKLRRASSKK